MMVSYTKQELLTLRTYPSLPVCFFIGGIRVAHLFSFLCCVFGGIRVAHLFSFLCCVLCFVCPCSLYCAKCCLCLRIVQNLSPLLFSLMFT